jgi:putative ABC transport system permease protein
MFLKPRWQKVIVDLWMNRTRTVLVVASIAVGLFAMGVITTIYLVIREDMRLGYAAVNPANSFIQTGLIEPGMADHIERMDVVSQVQGGRFVGMRVKNAQGEWQSFELQAAEDWAAQEMNRVQLLEGDWPQKGEVILSNHKLGDLNAGVGDMVQVELPSGKSFDLRVSGIVRDLTIGAYKGSGGFFLAAEQGYILQKTLPMLEQEQPDFYNNLLILLDENVSDYATIQRMTADISQELEDSGVDVVNSKAARSNDHPNSSIVDAIVGTLLVLGLLSVFLSSFLVTNMVQAILKQQTQQIGIMKSVGGRRVQIMLIYLVMILIFGVLAFAIACPLANWVSFPMLSFLADQLNFVLLGQRLVPQVIWLQAVLALLIPLMAAWLPIREGTRIRVREALTGMKEQEAGKKPPSFHKVPGLKKLSRPMLVALRNTFRRKGRLALTLITFSLAGAVFIATFNVQVSMDNYVKQLGRYFQADVNVTLRKPQRNQEVVQLLENIPGVGAVEVWAIEPAKLILENGASGERVQIFAPPVDSKLVTPIVSSGRWIIPGDTQTIVLSELFHERYPELAPGGSIRLRIGDKDTEWLVAGFFQFAGKNGGFSAYTQYPDLANVLGNTNRGTSFRVTGEHKNLTTAQQDELAARIQDVFKQEGIRIADLTTGKYLTSITGTGFATLTAFLLFLSVLIAIIGSIGLAGTMSMNVMERTREIGILRSVGASNWVLIRMVLVEGLTIGLLSYIFGSILSFPISTLLSNSITLALFGAVTSFGFSASGFVIWLGLVVLLSLLSSIVPALNAARLTIREVLAYE